ncbi:MAG: InlB B-repeat-containing protein [Bacteroidales bacterium]|nr:InlB B-repeat-containing protein [Bacteroidales bacterium]
MSTLINGRDVAVSGHAKVGGDAHIQGNVHVRHNLVVDGWADIKNIKGANRGIYLTMDDLVRANPRPLEGWFAGVGASSPFAAYVSRCGQWMPTGGTIAVNVDMSVYTAEVSALRGEVGRLSAIVANLIAPERPDTAVVTVLSSDASMGSVTGGGTYPVGSTVTLTAVANSGHRFVKWNDGNTQNPRTVAVGADVAYTAIFEADTPQEVTHTVTVGVAPGQQGMGSVSVNGNGTSASVADGGSVNLKATENAGYVFVRWSDRNTDAERTINGVTADMTLTATFAVARVIDIPTVVGATITAQAKLPGAAATEAYAEVQIADGKISVADGSTVKLTATPAEGKVFSGWYDGDELKSPDADYIFEATEKAEEMTLSVVVADEAPTWQDVTITLEIDGGTGSFVVEKKVGNNQWEPVGEQDGTGIAEISVTTADRLRLTATAGDGYIFNKWEVGDGVFATGNPKEIDVGYYFDGNGTIRAHFVQADFYYGAVDIPASGSHAADVANVAASLTGATISTATKTVSFSMGANKTFLLLYDETKAVPTSYRITTQIGDDTGSDFFTNTRKFYSKEGGVKVDGKTYQTVELKAGNSGSTAMPVEIVFTKQN